MSSASQPFGSVSSSSTAGPPPGDVLQRCRAHSQRVKAVQHLRADRVRRRDHLGPRAEVATKRQNPGVVAGRESIALLAEHVQVGVAESVYRLELVSDQEDLGRRSAQRLDQLQLQAVRVLEFVDHQLGEALAVQVADLRLGQQPHREQLQVFEVQPGAGRLLGAEAAVKEPQQLSNVVIDEAPFTRFGDAGGRGAKRLGAIASQALRFAEEEACELVERRRTFPRAQLQSTLQLSPLLLGFTPRPQRRGRSLFQLDHGRGNVSDRRVGQLRLIVAAAAQLAIGVDDHLSQPLDPVGRDGRLALGVCGDEEIFQGGVKRGAGGPRGLRLVENPKAGVDARGDRVCSKQPPAESMDGRDPSTPEARDHSAEAYGVLRICGLAAAQLVAHALAKLGRRLVGKCEGEDRVGREAVDHQVAVAVHEHPGLSGPRTGFEQHVAAPDADRVALLPGRLAGGGHAGSSSSSSSGTKKGARSRRQIGAKPQ